MKQSIGNFIAEIWAFVIHNLIGLGILQGFIWLTTSSS